MAATQPPGAALWLSLLDEVGLKADSVSWSGVIMTLCPFHRDVRPSLRLWPSGHWLCMSLKCRASGKTWVADPEGARAYGRAAFMVRLGLDPLPEPAVEEPDERQAGFLFGA